MDVDPIDTIRSRITFEESAGFSETEKADLVTSLCKSLQIIVQWNSKDYPTASPKALEFFPRLIRVGARALDRKKFDIRLTKDKKGMKAGSACDGEVVVGSKIIWINVNSGATGPLEIFIHEFTHFNLLNIYDNECKPYWESRRNPEVAAEQKAEMVKYNKLVAPRDIGWAGISIPKTNFISKTIPQGPNNQGFDGVRKSFIACDKTGGPPGSELTAENILLLETIPHVVEMIFVLTDINLDYEKIFAQVQDISTGTSFLFDLLLKELREREGVPTGE